MRSQVILVSLTLPYLSGTSNAVSDFRVHKLFYVVIYENLLGDLRYFVTMILFNLGICDKLQKPSVYSKNKYMFVTES